MTRAASQALASASAVRKEGQISRERPSKPLAKSRTIAGMGDSTTAGTPGFLSPVEAPPEGRGDPQSQYCYWMMKAHPEWSVLNRGVNGERSDQILSRFERDVVAEKPVVVIVLAGVNDIYQGRRVESVKRNLEAMYVMAERNGIVPVAATVLPYNSAGRRERSAIREVNVWVGDGVEGAREALLRHQPRRPRQGEPGHPRLQPRRASSRRGWIQEDGRGAHGHPREGGLLSRTAPR